MNQTWACIGLEREERRHSSQKLNAGFRYQYSGNFFFVFVVVCLFVCLVFCLFRAASSTHGGSQARGLSNRSYSCQLTSQPQECWIQAKSATYTTAHGNTGSLTHWARPGIEAATSWFLVRFVSAVPEQEFPYSTNSYWESSLLEDMLGTGGEGCIVVNKTKQTSALFFL